MFKLNYAKAKYACELFELRYIKGDDTQALFDQCVKDAIAGGIGLSEPESTTHSGIAGEE